MGLSPLGPLRRPPSSLEFSVFNPGFIRGCVTYLYARGYAPGDVIHRQKMAASADFLCPNLARFYA